MAGSRKEKNGNRRIRVPTSWDAFAEWYDGWVGEHGSEFHREVAIPAVLDLLAPKPNEQILDIGSGQGVLAPYVRKAGARYTGVDASPRLVEKARTRHGKMGRFVVGDARDLASVRQIAPGSFDAAVFMLSIQDMDPLASVIGSAAGALAAGGRIVMLLTHPAFRVPRQSGWGWDEARGLQYRRVDRYLTPLRVPMKTLESARGGRAEGSSGSGERTRSFHRPVSAYVNALAEHGLLVERMLEVPGHKADGPGGGKAADTARTEIPLFLGIRAYKPARGPGYVPKE